MNESQAGKPWPEVEIQVSRPSKSPEPRIWFLALFAVLLVAFTTYGMAKSDQGILDEVFELVRSGLFAALGWAFGRHETQEGQE